MIYLFILACVVAASFAWALSSHLKFWSKHKTILRQTFATQNAHLRNLRKRIKGRYHHTFRNKSHRERQSAIDTIDHIQRYNQTWSDGLTGKTL